MEQTSALLRVLAKALGLPFGSAVGLALLAELGLALLAELGLALLAELGLALLAELGLALWQCGRACPTVPLPIDRSEAACRRLLLSRVSHAPRKC